MEDVDMWKWIKTKSGARRRKGRPVARIWLNTRMGGIWQNDGWTVQDDKKIQTDGDAIVITKENKTEEKQDTLEKVSELQAQSDDDDANSKREITKTTDNKLDKRQKIHE